MSKKLTSMLNNVAISDNIFMNCFLYTLRCCDFTHMLTHLCYFYNVVGIYLHIFFVFSFRMSFFAIIRFRTTHFRLPRYAKNDFDFKNYRMVLWTFWNYQKRAIWIETVIVFWQLKNTAWTIIYGIWFLIF